MFSCAPVDRASDSLKAPPKGIRTGALSSFAWSAGTQLTPSFASDFQWRGLAVEGSPTVMQQFVSFKSSSWLFQSS